MLFFLFLCTPLHAQPENSARTAPVDIPLFFFEALGFWDSDSAARMDLYVQVPYQALRFTADGNSYTARYEVTVNILDEDERSVAERIWSEEVTPPDADPERIKWSSSFSQRSLVIRPGKYKFRLQVKDLESRKAGSLLRDVTVASFDSSRFFFSDIMLVNRVRRDENRRTLIPNITGNIGENRTGFSFFTELYNRTDADSAVIKISIADKMDRVLSTKSEGYKLTGFKTQIISTVDSSHYAVGLYTLRLTAGTVPGKKEDASLTAVQQRLFNLRWSGLPYTIVDIDLAIRQLRYIATEEEYSRLTEAPTLEEKQRLFKAFWRERDSSPDNDRSEAMDEYYARVEYANKQFSHYIEGWRTDMGMVFIIFGSPNNIDRHPFDVDTKPYEIWSYYDFNKQLIFLDETGFGDYRLLTPIWDMLHRVTKRR